MEAKQENLLFVQKCKSIYTSEICCQKIYRFDSRQQKGFADVLECMLRLLKTLDCE